jgi:hypothetical protein
MASLDKRPILDVYQGLSWPCCLMAAKAVTDMLAFRPYS